jgi:hypothetical protein
MMKKIFLPVLVSLILLVPVQAAAQNTSGSSALEPDTVPQWAKDMRRFDIIFFGSFPFAMFFSTFFMDTYRWGVHSGFQDTAYASWPLKSAGAIEMEKKEFRITLGVAFGLSAVIAATDLLIVNVKRNRERRRIESMPEGTTIIIRTPYQNPDFDESGLYEPEPESEDPHTE